MTLNSIINIIESYVWLSNFIFNAKRDIHFVRSSESRSKFSSESNWQNFTIELFLLADWSAPPTPSHDRALIGREKNCHRCSEMPAGEFWEEIWDSGQLGFFLGFSEDGIAELDPQVRRLHEARGGFPGEDRHRRRNHHYLHHSMPHPLRIWFGLVTPT